jgi:DNA recombination protein RmuC
MSVAIELLIVGIAGLGIGMLLGWLLGSKRPAPSAPADNRLENDLRQRLSQREDEQRELQKQLQAASQSNGQFQSEIKSLNERLATERQQLESIQKKFREDFEAVSNKLLLNNSNEFNKQSSENLDRILKPLKEELKDFKTKLETTYQATSNYSAVLQNEIGRIGTEAANLSKALKGDVKALGNWGENMLDQILEKSGLQLDVHYRRQHSGKGDDGDLRFLDVVVELPDKKNLIIDSKVSLAKYEEYVNSTDDRERTELLESHIECLRAHFRGLGAKRYQDIVGINAPDFVLMYIPIEPAFFVAIAHRPGLFAEALSKNVVLITNSTLLATLRTVTSIWRLAKEQKNSQEIAKRGGLLYEKFVGFVTDLQQVGASLKTSQQVWADAFSKLQTGQGNLIWQAEQLKELGAKTIKTIPHNLIDKTDENNTSTPPPTS